MPKIAVAIISAAIAWVVGFLLGALFTLPQNKDMEELVNAKKEMTKQITVLQADNQKLREDSLSLKKQVLDLKDKLLQAYEIDKEATTSNLGVQ